MQTLRTIIWALIAAALAIFAVSNWQIVTVAVWPGYSAELPLPLLIIGSFLLGFLPPFIVYAASKWRARKTIEQQAQVISDLRTAPSPTAAPEPQIVHTPIDADPVTGTVDSSRPV
jgi:lipopolysaccharide assembly protein A